MPTTRRPATRTGEALRPVAAAVFHVLDFTGIQLHPQVLRGVRGRADIVTTARALGFPARRRRGGLPARQPHRRARRIPRSLLHLCASAGGNGDSTVTVRAVDEVIAPPLRAFLNPWTRHLASDAESVDSARR